MYTQIKIHTFLVSLKGSEIKLSHAKKKKKKKKFFKMTQLKNI